MSTTKLIESEYPPYLESYDAERRGLPANKPYMENMFGDIEQKGKPAARFMIITTTDMKSIRQKYERSQMASKSFYDRIMADGRFHLVDGPALFPVVRGAYRKQSILPANMTLQLAKPFIHMEPVYVGIIAADQLKALYAEYGNALFLENIRKFLGQSSGRIAPSVGQITVNKEITKTLAEEPRKFLSRNNGITFCAASVVPVDDMTLRLDGASIVNGCQTTMSVVQTPGEGSYVLVKVVQATDTWDIAEAANFQNEIKRLDLRLARYIRPQEIRTVASRVNIGFKSPSEEASAFAMLDAFYQKEITYEEVRSLFIGLFSNTPNNAIDTNYTKLKNEIIRQIFEKSEDKEKTFEILFKIHRIT